MAYAQVSPASVPLAGSITPLTLRPHRQLCRASKAATPTFTAANTSLTTPESFGYPNGASADNAGDEDDPGETNVDPNVVKITSDDPLAAARAAAILRLVSFLNRSIFVVIMLTSHDL